MRRRTYLAFALLVLLLVWLAFRFLSSPPTDSIYGIVRDASGPVVGASVRFKGEALTVRTDADGRFTLPRPSAGAARVTASRDGYRIGGASADATPLVLGLQRLPANDCEAYRWVDPAPGAGRHNCGNCHGEIYREWSLSGHARATTNRRFRNIYDGSDWLGRPNRGWNLLADHPDGAGVCTSCHAPSVAFNDSAYFDLREAAGVPALGVHCDYCHKVAGVTEGQVGITHGRFGLKLLRPSSEDQEIKRQLFFGPLDDVDRGEDAFSRLYRSSRYCASCHEGVVFGVPVYTTYSEWLQSPARAEGKQCQSCHMAPTGSMTNIAPARGGIERDPHTLASHRMLAGSLEAMLRQCLTLGARLTSTGAGVVAEVEVRAENVGHRVPTGFVDRHLLLVVEALRHGQTVPLRSGPVLPAVAGLEFAGRPGRLFARQLRDREGHSPVPFWQALTDPIDSRLLPGQSERSRFTFATGADRVRARLIYRRFWPDVVVSKGWPNDSIIVATQEWPVAAE